MSETTAHDEIAQALETLEEAKSEPTGGKWLERLTAQMAPYIKEWDISHCWTWAEWPDRERLLPETTSQDNGIDAVAIDRSTGAYIAIQCKSRQLDEYGHGKGIDRPEITSFISESDNELYAERWLITNGDNRLNANAERTNSQLNKKIKLFNLHADLTAQAQGSIKDEECPHCQPNPDGEWRSQSKTCMQNDAVSTAVSRLKGQLETDLDGIPAGQSRGKIILPCGTGKTRISLQIIEELTPPGGLSVVLCPSIALVAQIRREYLQNAENPIRALAVCSDETAGYDPKKEGQRNTFEEVTADSSNISADEIKGKVTTDPEEIAQWIGEGAEDGRISVIFGTYQSGHRIAEALWTSETPAEVLICDEAHRTAGLRRTKRSTVDQIKDFTLCHDNGKFPSKHRIYQTATPKIYTQKALREKQKEDWVVRNMDDQSVFGPDLFRRSYRDAVNNEWLSDYRIIAVGISGAESHEVANALASTTESKGRNPLTSTHFLRGLAFTLAMGGATKGREDEEINIQSCIAFMNTVDKSDNMVKALDTEPVRNWLRDRMREMETDKVPAAYTLDHLDASSNVTKREEAKAKLAEGTLEKPHGVINVGIFGEGTDSPSLSAVAFLEARRSPIDVVQAVGRAMRTSPGKDKGYVICPIVIPLDTDAENFLKTSNPQDGWKELGDILLALRAHDERIEDRLAELMTLYLPPEPEVVKTIVGIAHEESRRMSYWEHVGKPGSAELALQEVLEGTRSPASAFGKVSEPPEPKGVMEAGAEYRTATTDRPIEPSQSLSGKSKDNGETELRKGGVEREKPDEKTGMPGKVDIDKTKSKIIKPMAEGKGGTVVTPARERKPRRTQAELSAQAAMRLMELDANEERSKLITMNLLEKSGLRGNRPERDANMIQDSIYEAAHQLRNDSLKDPLDRHFNLNYLDDKARENQADGCTIAALLMMNAAMLHQRINAGRWLDGVESLDVIKNSNNPVSEIKEQWNTIRARDFRPVIEPALEAIRAMERTGRTGGLVKAVRHIAKEAEELAASYADLGADHAGPLFNRVMGNQASDGAYFTRPVAASIAARLTLDALGEQDWTNEETWKAHKSVDLACGSGTLLTALLTEMKRRAKEQGATASDINQLQKTAVEDTLKGMDINPISLQLAASQLTTGNQDIGYRRMGLHRMPYGPDMSDPTKVSAGTLEILGQKEIVPRNGELDLPDARIASEEVWTQGGEAMEDAVDAVKGGVRIVIMNPPFTSRSKMGEKFPQETQRSLRKRVDDLERLLVRNDKDMEDFVDKNALGPLFVALADRCLEASTGVLTMIHPTIALTNPSGQYERKVLAQRYHIHTILTGRWPREFTLSQNVEIDECMVVAVRHVGNRPSTRFIQLDRMPHNEDEVAKLHQALLDCPDGLLADSWGEVSHWSAERIETGDWTPAIWRSPELAEAARRFANHDSLQSLDEVGLSAHQTGREIYTPFERGSIDAPNAFPIVKSKGADGQSRIRSSPDEYWIPKKGYGINDVENFLRKREYLLVTEGQDNRTSRLVAVASDEKHVGGGWMPVEGVAAEEAKAIAVFFNSTPGRLQLMRNAGKKIFFPAYRPAGLRTIRIPDVKDARIRRVLADCWGRTKEMEVPQFRDGECDVRRFWDEAVAEALGWDAAELAHLRELLHQEPHVRGLGYGQYADETEEEQEWDEADADELPDTEED